MVTHYIHRGLAKKNFKENTLSAFKYSFKKKYGIETDLQVTKDNQLICFHDLNLRRKFNLNKNVKDINYSSLKKISKKRKATVPLLKDLLKISKNRYPLLLEIKPLLTKLSLLSLVKLMKNSHVEMQDFSDIYPKVNVPVMHITGWWDRLIGTVDTFIGLDKQKNPIKNYHKLIIGPWGHDNGNFKGNIGPVNYGKEADESYSDLIIKWYDHQFKGKELIFPKNKRVKLFILGSNKWEYYSKWPPENSENKIYYLHSNGDANVKNSNGILNTKLPNQEPPDTYKYDPKDPVMSLMLQNSQTVPMDQRPNHNRNDILLYETDKFQSPTKFIGNPIAKLWASSDAKDTDWVVKLVIVYENDIPVNLCYEILRAKYRNSYENNDLIPNTDPIEYTIKLRPLGINVLKGQKLRLYITSSDFPNHDRNHNTGNDFWNDNEFKIATQKIYHDVNYPSKLILPRMKN